MIWTGLILLLRRYLLPVLVAAAAAPVATCYGMVLAAPEPGLTIPGYLIVPMGCVIVTPFALPFTALGIALFGVPAGYAVAAFRAGLAISLLLLATIGGLVGALVLQRLSGPVPSDVPFFSPLSGSLAGAASALVWGLINRDLFRRTPDAPPA